MIHKHCPEVETVLDACAGTTRVSQALRKGGYSVTANDLAVYSKVFAQCYLLNTHPKEHYEPWIAELNAIDGVDGWFSQHYGGLVTSKPLGNAIQEDGQKRPWQLHNTKKLDAILERIPLLTQDTIERAVLLSSTMLAMDKVDNILSDGRGEDGWKSGSVSHDDENPGYFLQEVSGPCVVPTTGGRTYPTSG